MSPLGGLRETVGIPFSLPEGRIYSPPARGRRWYPSRWSGTRALRGGLRLLRKPPDNATTLAGAAVIVCADGKTQPQTCLCGGLRFVTHLPPACSKLSQEQSFGYVQAALPQIGHRLRRHPILFAKKKQKARAQNDGVTVRYPIFERGRKGCEFNAHPCSLASI